MNHQEELIKFVSEIEDGIFFIDHKGYLTFCNEGWESITCFSKSELFSKNWVDLFHEQDLEQASLLSHFCVWCVVKKGRYIYIWLASEQGTEGCAVT